MRNYIVSLFAIATFLTLLLNCGVIGGPPANLQITAATDSTVQIFWTTPAQGVPDSFLIYFCPAGDSVFTIIGNTTGNTYLHNPSGITGSYQVSAIFASKEYRADITLSTTPIPTPSKVISELDGTGNAGYGWNRDSGQARTYSMRDAGNVDNVDFYVTDFTTGSRPPFNIASPHMGPSDPSGVVPPDTTWSRNGFTNPLTDENAPLPAIDPTRYFNYTTIPESLPALIGCYTTADRHYALIKITRVNTANATVELETWLQLIPELRLIYHPLER